MKHTAVQRRLIEDGVLDYGPSLSGSPAKLTQATPPGAPTHASGGSASDVQAPRPRQERFTIWMQDGKKKSSVMSYSSKKEAKDQLRDLKSTSPKKMYWISSETGI